MSIKNIRPYEASAFNPRTRGFYGICSFCAHRYEGRRAESMGTDRAGRNFALCRHHAASVVEVRIPLPDDARLSNELIQYAWESVQDE